MTELRQSLGGQSLIQRKVGGFIKRIIAITTSLLVIVITLFTTVEARTYDVSAYTWSGNRMANGEYPHVGAVAADDLPLGTKIRINGKVYVVKDRFGGGYTNRLDIYMDSHQEAINFGRQYLEVEVIG